MKDEQYAKIDAFIAKASKKKDVFDICLRIESGDSHFSYQKEDDATYFIASSTKLYTTALIMQAMDKDLLHAEDRIATFFSDKLMNRLHIHKGKDYSQQITIKHLLAHSSGIGDYFGGKLPNGSTHFKNIVQNEDRELSFEEAITLAKQVGAKFTPNPPDKGHYSDTNFQLLGKIIEYVYDNDFNEVLKNQIIEPLALQNTYMYSTNSPEPTLPLRFKQKRLHIPLAMSSVKADGGIVSNNQDGISFSRAFWGGKLFSEERLASLTTEWRSIFFPLQYGIGVMRYTLPNFINRLVKQPELIGHSGLSGAFLWYAPQLNLHFSGTVNQLSQPDLSYRLLGEILGVLKNERE
ncbi:MAG: serine hydrolase domain-containing protein [Bacilli bacterium]